MSVNAIVSALPLLALVAASPPVAAPSASSAREWARVCKPWDDWSKPGPPYRIDANSYYVGTCGITAILIVGDQGDILIDGGPSGAASLIAKNIKSVGRRLGDVKILLHSHEHFDHAGGLAELKRLTGARLLASPAAARALKRGEPQPDDPQYADKAIFPRVSVDGLVRDRSVIRLGKLALTAYATPGHTHGALSWNWRSCTQSKCRSVVYADSLSPVSSESYRFSDHPAFVAAFRRSIATIANLPCDILLTPHPSQAEMVERAATGSMVGGLSCKDRAGAVEIALDERLAKESHGG